MLAFQSPRAKIKTIPINAYQKGSLVIIVGLGSRLAQAQLRLDLGWKIKSLFDLQILSREIILASFVFERRHSKNVSLQQQRLKIMVRFLWTVKNARNAVMLLQSESGVAVHRGVFNLKLNWPRS